MAIHAYFRCKTCYQNSDDDHIEVGMSDPETLTVHCAKCDNDVGQFKLAKPMPWGKCSVCGEKLGPEHKH